MKNASANPTPQTDLPCTRHRVHAFDALRGYTVLSMIGFHTAYDLAYLYQIDMAWFTTGPFQELWRISISWVFLALAGWMTIHSRSNMRRGGQYACVAFLVWVVTAIADVDTPISFGIIYCMAACTLGYAVLERTALIRSSGPGACTAASAMCVALFLISYRVPHVRYEVQGLAWLGFPHEGFASGDYYPLIPFGFLYLASALAARAWRQSSKGAYPTWLQRIHCAPLESIGRHALLLYVVHQPLVLALLRFAFRA